MPPHDWTDRDGWEGMHIFWMTKIARELRAILPHGYRAVIGSSPLVAVSSDVALADAGQDFNVLVEREGRLVAAVELISPRNKDRPSARDQYAARYLNYLRGGIHLLIADVHRRPVGFSFPQLIAAALDPQLPAPAAPSGAAYRVGATAATGGRMLAAWQDPFVAGEPLPPAFLPLSLDAFVTIDLDGTYSRAAADSYVA